MIITRVSKDSGRLSLFQQIVLKWILEVSYPLFHIIYYLMECVGFWDYQLILFAPWGLWCRALRFFMFVCLSLLLFVVCLSSRYLNCPKMKLPNPPVEKKILSWMDQKRIRFWTAAGSVKWRGFASLNMLWMSNHVKCPSTPLDPRGHPCPAGVI